MRKYRLVYQVSADQGDETDSARFSDDSQNEEEFTARSDVHATKRLTKIKKKIRDDNKGLTVQFGEFVRIIRDFVGDTT